jgi:hypothetical protein
VQPVSVNVPDAIFYFTNAEKSSLITN